MLDHPLLRLVHMVHPMDRLYLRLNPTVNSLQPKAMTSTLPSLLQLLR